MNGRKKIAVIGGGIAGLAAALEVCADAEVEILEAAGSVGGVVSTLREGGFVIERGPDSFFSDEETAGFLSKIGISGDRLVAASERGRRVFIMSNGRAVALPEGFFMTAPRKLAPFLASPLFSFSCKLRTLAEFFVPARRGGTEESVADFVRRRFGDEILAKAAAPLVGGIYCAPPEVLGAESALPEFVAMERARGSVLRGLLGRGEGKGESGARFGRFFSPAGGMSEIVEAAVRALPQNCVRTGFEVSSLVKKGGAWEIVSNKGETARADAIVVAAPCGAASSMLSDTDAELSALLASVRYSSCAVASLAYGNDLLTGVPDGFGVLFPDTEPGRVFACSFLSRKFPGRAPGGQTIIRFFMGGDDVCGLSGEEIVSRARDTAREVFRASGEPSVAAVGNYRRRMPVYEPGHKELVSRIMNAARRTGGIALAGAAYGGVGIPDCIRGGRRAGADALGLASRDLRKPRGEG